MRTKISRQWLSNSRRSNASRTFLALVLLTGQVSVARADNVTGMTGNGSPLENRQPTLVVRYMIAIQGPYPDDAQGTPGGFPPEREDAFLGEIKPVPFNFAPRNWMFCEGQLLPINQNMALFSLLGTAYGGDGVTTFALPDLRNRLPMGAGQGPGLPNYVLGQQVGNACPTLSAANLPRHTHTTPGGSTQVTGSGAPIDNRQPSLALHFLIAGNGEIMIVPWSRQPTGWTRCDGRLLPRVTHQFLYAHLSTTYGGNSTNFALPDLRGRVVVGEDEVRARGLAFGSNQTLLAVADIQAHTHTLSSGSTGSSGASGNSASNYQPSLVLRRIMALVGHFPTPNGVLSPFVGEMRLSAGPIAFGLPSKEWPELYGQLYAISQNQHLYTLIGTTYGGDGQQTVGLPNLAGRVDLSAFPNNAIGSVIGSPTLTVDIARIAPHAHLVDLGITGIQHFGNGSATITLTGMPGSSCTVDRSDDLVTWTNLGTVQFQSGTQTITDPNLSQALKRFYRARP